MDRLRLERLWAQGLAHPSGRDVVSVVRRLLTVQAQDPRGARLAIRARTVGATTGDVDEALDRGELVVSWLNRGTLHLVATEDHWWLHSLTAPRQLTGNRRRLHQEGVDDRQAKLGVEVVATAVRERGPHTRDQLRVLLDEAGVPTAGQALVHVLFAASLAGHLVRGPLVDGRHAFVDAIAWCGEPDDLDAETASTRLARRYLEAHGPAAAEDLAKWAGVTLGVARQGFAGVADEVVDVGDGLVRLAAAEEPQGLPGPRLLGPFDPVLHGWASREFVVGPHKGVVTTNGIFRASVLVDGRVVGLWSLTRDGVEVRALEPIHRAVVPQLAAEAADVERFLEREPTGHLTVAG